jgi:glycosyltransferase involved in cell wall biosynthesis
MYPKVLIISNNALSLHFNNGKTYHSLFRDWQKENIAQLYFHYEIPESDRFYKFYRITDIDILKCKILNKKSCGKRMCPQEFLERRENDSSFVSKFKKGIFSFLQKQRSAIAIVKNTVYRYKAWQTEDFKSWLIEFNPDIIFTVGGNYTYLYEITEWISNFLSIPYTLFLTDDYLIYNKGVGIFSRRIHKSLSFTFKRFIEKSSHLFVIGDLMGREYKEKFGKDYSTIMNCVDITSKPAPTLKQEKSKVVIRYIGGVYLNRWKSLVAIGELLRNTEVDVIVEIYTLEEPEKEILKRLNEHPLSYCGPLYGNEVARKIQEADFLLHVESTSVEYKNITKLSISTKIPQYLVSGKCIIAFGPCDIASIKLLSENKLAVVLFDTDSTDVQIDKLKAIFSNDSLYNKLAQNALNYVYKHLNGITMRKDLLEVLNDIINKHHV